MSRIISGLIIRIKKLLIKNLKAHADRLSEASLESLSALRSGSVWKIAGWTLNASRQYLDADAETELMNLAQARNISASIKALFAGDHVNSSEDRPALHWALRAETSSNPEAEAVRASLDPALDFAERVRAEGKFETVLHLGIGGSDFGPRLLHDACKNDYPGKVDVRFAANVDPLDLDRALAGLNPETTLVVGVSKSFSSEETMYNLERARDWVEQGVGSAWPAHMALVTASPEKAQAWLKVANGQIFDMPLSVGGRFSLWSNASLACMIAFGRDWFDAFLAGARQIDEHVRTADLSENVPLRLALFDYWNMTLRGIHSNIVLGYSNALRMLPTYLQQLELESNGKSVQPDGSALPAHSIVGLWGGEGTIGQHSYHQWLHQGAANIAAEFVIALNPTRDAAGSRALVAHALAQAEVLANGRTEADIALEEPGLSSEIRKQKIMPGGKPSLILACRDFNVSNLGSLIALYEHRTFLAGRLWMVNSFDQWGVERGKVQAAKIKQALMSGDPLPDPITSQLVDFFRG